MSNSVDTTNTQVAQLSQWAAEQTESPVLNEDQKQAISNKPNLLSTSRQLAADTKDILLSEMDNENAFNASIEQDLSIPTLPAPTTNVKTLNQNGKSVELLSTLMMLSSEMSLHQLSLQLSNFMVLYENYRKASNGLDKELNSLLDKVEHIKGEVTEAQDKLSTLQSNVEQICEKMQQKQHELDTLEQGSPQYQDVLSQLEMLKKEAAEAKKSVEDQKVVLKQGLVNAGKMLQEATEKLEEQDTFSDKHSIASNQPGSNNRLTNAARLSELIAYFMQLINKNSETELNSQMSIFEAMQKSVKNQMENKAKETEEQQQKAEQLKDVMGHVGKAVGAIVTVFSVLSAAFTGGASLALAGVGLALMSGDFIAEAVTNESLTDRIMTPFMEHIFLPLMGVIEKVVGKLFEYTPLGKLLDLISEITGTDITNIAKTAVSALVTIAIIVAVAYVAKIGVSALAKKLSDSALGQMLKNIVPEVTTDLVKQVADSVVKSLGEISAKVGLKNQKTAERALQLQKLMQFVSYGNQGAQVTSNVVIANFKEQATQSMATFKISQADLENIKKVLESVIAEFEKSQGTYQDVAKLISDSMHTESNTGKQVLSNLRV